MNGTDGPWKLQGFPEKVECPAGPAAGEVQQVYEQWVETRRVNPRQGAVPVDAGGDRYTAKVQGARYVDENSIEWQLLCDYDIHPGAWGKPGEVIYVDSGFVPSPDQPD
jgi:hypothetical protein